MITQLKSVSRRHHRHRHHRHRHHRHRHHRRRHRRHRHRHHRRRHRHHRRHRRRDWRRNLCRRRLPNHLRQTSTPDSPGRIPLYQILLFRHRHHRKDWKRSLCRRRLPNHLHQTPTPDFPGRIPLYQILFFHHRHHQRYWKRNPCHRQSHLLYAFFFSSVSFLFMYFQTPYARCRLSSCFSSSLLASFIHPHPTNLYRWADRCPFAHSVSSQSTRQYLALYTL